VKQRPYSRRGVVCGLILAALAETLLPGGLQTQGLDYVKAYDAKYEYRSPVRESKVGRVVQAGVGRTFARWPREEPTPGVR
jgi:hypothetical protein